MRNVSVALAIIGWLSMSAVAGAAAGDSTEVVLHEQNGSGVTGTATLRDNGDGTTTLRIELKGDEDGAEHLAHLHEGTCAETVPTVTFPIENVVEGRSVTRVRASLDQLLDEKLYVNIHPSAQELSPILACGGLNVPSRVPDTGGGGSRGAASATPWSGFAALLAICAAGMLATARVRPRRTALK